MNCYSPIVLAHVLLWAFVLQVLSLFQHVAAVGGRDPYPTPLNKNGNIAFARVIGKRKEFPYQ